MLQSNRTTFIGHESYDRTELCHTEAGTTSVARKILSCAVKVHKQIDRNTFTSSIGCKPIFETLDTSPNVGCS
jgi:hypothetical protein